MNAPAEQGTVVILGAGAPDGLGGGLARRFAAAGHPVLVTGRTLAKVEAVADQVREAGGTAAAMAVDVTSADDQDALFQAAAAKGPVAAVLYNAGNNAILPFAELTAAQFEQFWRIGCYGAFLTAKRAVPILKAQGGGSLFFTGASGSLRGKANFAHFASAKAALRNLAQSLAREYGKDGLHVAHFIIDGVIDGQRIRDILADYVDGLGPDGALDPDAIAEAFWAVHVQKRSAWTHEMDLRPYKEDW